MYKIIDKNTLESLGTVCVDGNPIREEIELDEALELCGYDVSGGFVIDGEGVKVCLYSDIRLHWEPDNIERFAEWLYWGLLYSENDIKEMAGVFDLVPWEVEYILKMFRVFDNEDLSLQLPRMSRYFPAFAKK